MKILKNVFSQLHTYVLWALISVLLWGWIFGLVNDAPAEKKVVIYAQIGACRDVALDEALEKDPPDGIRLIRIHTFDYAMFDEYSLLHADLYIIRASDLEDYADSFRPFENGAFPVSGGGYWERDGLVYGVKIFDASAGSGPAESYITYFAPGEPVQDCYLCFGAGSVHPAGPGNAPAAVAEKLLKLP